MFRSLFILVALVIFVSNLLGLIGLSFVLTSYLSITLSLSLIAFVSFNLACIVFFGKHWLKVFLPYNIPVFGAYPVVFLEAVSYVLRIVSLSVRLFANITAGHLLLGVLSGIV
jgi:F-type H+-transporting ATPase subunit a